MFATIFIPNFGLQAQLRLRSGFDQSGRAAALLDDSVLTAKTKKDRGKSRVVQRNEAAARAGVEIGMTATHAQARCPALELLNRNPEDEAAGQTDLLSCAESFSADFESTGEGIATLNLFSVRGKAKPKKLAREIVDWLAGASFSARVGIAANPNLALLAAKLANPIETIRGTREDIRKFLAPLPVEALSPAPEIREVLGLWGVRTLGDFTMLPRHEVCERLGVEAGELWDHAGGTRRRLLRLVRPSVDYSQTIDLDYEIDSLEPLLFMIQRALEVIGSRLAANYLVAERIELIFDYSDGSAYRREFRIPDPSRDQQLLFRIMHTHLEDFETKAPIRGLKLEATATKPLRHQFKLFESTLRDPNRFGETLARLEALLGSENVGVPDLLPSNKPDAFRVAPFDAERRTCDPENPGMFAKTPVAGLPLRRFRPPRPVLVATERFGPFDRPREITNGALRGPIHDFRGPWLSSGDWWDRFAWARQEWDVELIDGGLYRLVHEEKKWKLDGVYG